MEVSFARSRMRPSFLSWRACLVDDERGFTLTETVVAITIIFGMLISLAVVVTAGFGYQARARQQQSANGVANGIMEEIRGLPFDTIESGLLSTDLSGDSNILDCGGTKRLFACTSSPGSIPGTAEKVVTSAGLSNTDPLVPHRSSTSPNQPVVLNNKTFGWATYVSQNDAATGAPHPYRVTIVVTWTTVGGTSKSVRVQSLFWSPAGCKSTSVHPYSAPCQPLLYGEAIVPSASIMFAPVSGSQEPIQGVQLSTAELMTSEAEATVQQELLAQAQASSQASGVRFTQTDGTELLTGNVEARATADNDAGSTVTAYSRVRCATEVTCTGGTASYPSSGASTRLSFIVPTVTDGQGVATTSATGTNACPPTNVQATGETDFLPCSAAAIRQPSTVTANAVLGGTTPALGTVTLGQVLAPGSSTLAPIRAFANRVANVAPSSAGCTPGAGTDGCVAISANRTMGTINIGALPSGLGTPAHWAGSSAWNGFYLSVVGYQDSATAAAGAGAPVPATTGPAGTLYYYDATTSDYSTIALNSSSITGLSKTFTTSGSISGTVVTVTMSIDGTGTTAASTSTSANPSTSGSVTRNTVTAQVVPPVITVNYRITVPGATLVDTVITINLGTLGLAGTYAAAPSQGT
jgi:type II secretory pathway pseudopilin PulG